MIVAVIAAAAVWATGVFGPYGWFSDELYFLACAKRPALGYVDHPPLATLLLAALRVVCHDHLALIRLVPAAVYGFAIVQVARIARALGGGAFAQTLAAAVLAAAPAVIVIAGFYSMNPFELLLLAILARIALALAGDAPPRTWLWFGAVTGVAVLVKHSAVFTAGLLGVATLLSPARAHLRTRWPYLGAVLAALLAAPNVIWLARNDWVTLEFYRTSVPLKNIPQTPLEALVGQAMFVGPLVFAVAVAGAIALARTPGRRGFALMFAIALAAMMASGISRADRILGVYPILFAAGACAIEKLGRARYAAAAMLAIGALPPLPLVLPVLPPPLVERYSRALGVTPELEAAKRGAMPQWLADRRGWPEVAAATAAVHRELAAEDQRTAVWFGADYALAGALELAGAPVPVISTHDAFWTWGPRASSVVVAVGYDERYWRALYADVTRAGTVRCTGCLVDGTAIWIARRPSPGLAARWAQLRRFE